MKKILSVLLGLCFLSACTTDPYTGESRGSRTAYGTGIGAATGALAGALIGGNTKGALVGAAIGGGLGAATGGYMDYQANELRKELTGTGVQIKELEGQIILIMPSNITFDVDKYNIKEKFKPVLDSVAKVLKKYDRTLVQVIGHTDNTGTLAHNMELSARRAENVALYLNLREIDRNRITYSGVGPNQPVASNSTEAGRELNRRVEIVLINAQ